MSSRRSRRSSLLAGAMAVVGAAAVGCAGDDTDGAGSAGSGDGAACERAVDPERSVARHWNEALLAAIRSDFPAPTVHARNLYHSSAAMWDAWAAYDDRARGVFVEESAASSDMTVDEVMVAREEAMSFAAYRILVERYLPSPGAEDAVTRLDELMVSLCYDAGDESTDGSSPAALGNRIAETVLAGTVDDGANEADGYVADYRPVNPPLVVDRAGTEMVDPNRWQPLELEVMVAQNGLPLDDTVQTFVGPHWGRVTPFALEPARDGLPVDPGPPPMLGDPDSDAAFKEAVNEVLRHSATLDPADGEVIDLSPAVTGDRALGSYDALGRPVNPSTGEPYTADPALAGDYGRVVAEYWADGPQSETPPGHWNSIANDAIDAFADLGSLRIGGEGEPVDRLEFDTKLYLALNGAVHDAAIAAWGAKGHYDYVRPISMIRWMGGLGQSSDPAAGSYDPDGLLLEPGLVEIVTPESSAPGMPHADLAGYVGEIAVRAWRGEPDDSENEAGGVGWMRAVEWVPYQRSTFVSPAFAAYVSGHSTFSRAAAEVLTAMTGDEYFPGGIARLRVGAGELEFEAGPERDVTLQWATYRDAADEAGRSRLFGGIHVRADDLAGREIGADVGVAAWAHATEFFGDTSASDEG